MKGIKNNVISEKTVSWGELKAYEFNSLKQADNRDISKLKNAIVNSGFNFPFYLWHGHRYVIDGNGRNLALMELEAEGYQIPDLPVIEIQADNKTQAKKLVLQASSAHGEVTKESFDDFAIDLELSDLDFEMINFYFDGFEDFELPEDVTMIPEDADVDEVPETPVEPRTKLGDIWICGNHRVMCGDSASIDAVEKLMDGKKADMVFTDPPYGISIVSGNKKVGGVTKFSKVGVGKIGSSKIVDAKTYSQILGDETTDTARDFYNTCISAGFKNFIIWGGNYFTDFLKPSMCWLVWDKENTGNFADVELAWCSNNSAAKLYKWLWNGMSRKGDHKTEGSTRVHPTQKPVGLFIDIFKDFEFKNCYDGFGGSGSTLIACEKTNRTCYMMELDQKYCDVIVTRWQNLTGKKAALESTGELF